MLHYLNTSLINIKGESWKDVPGYEGLYKISSMGRIKSFPRLHHIMPNGGRLFTKLRILKQTPCCDGLYLKVNIYKDKIQRTIQIHTLMGIVFIKNPYNKPEINHKNGIKFDNRKTNLEWATSKENSVHALETGLSTFKLNKVDVINIRKSTLSKIQLAKNYNLCLSQIYRVINRRQWSHIK